MSAKRFNVTIKDAPANRAPKGMIEHMHRLLEAADMPTDLTYRFNLGGAEKGNAQRKTDGWGGFKLKMGYLVDFWAQPGVNNTSRSLTLELPRAKAEGLFNKLSQAKLADLNLKEEAAGDESEEEVQREEEPGEAAAPAPVPAQTEPSPATKRLQEAEAVVAKGEKELRQLEAEYAGTERALAACDEQIFELDVQIEELSQKRLGLMNGKREALLADQKALTDFRIEAEEALNEFKETHLKTARREHLMELLRTQGIDPAFAKSILLEEDDGPPNPG